MTSFEPRKPTVLRWFPSTTDARVCLYPMVDPGTLTRIDYRIYRVSDDSTVVDSNITTGLGPSFTISSLSMVAGEEYELQIRFYTTEYGTSNWSKANYARVPHAELAGTRITVQAEPTASSSLSFEPDEAQPIEFHRARRRWVTETKHVMVRPKTTRGRRAAKLVWNALTETQRNTLLAELEALAIADPPQGFTLTGEAFELEPYATAGKWFARNGRRAQVDHGDGTFTITAEVDEILQ